MQARTSCLRTSSGPTATKTARVNLKVWVCLLLLDGSILPVRLSIAGPVHSPGDFAANLGEVLGVGGGGRLLHARGDEEAPPELLPES